MCILTLCIFLFAACGKSEKHTIEFLIPAESTEDFAYSDTEICPIGNKITISAGAGIADTEVILEPVRDTITPGYVAERLTREKPVKYDTAGVKDEWFRIGVSVQNDSDRGPIAVAVEVEGVVARAAESIDDGGM